MCSAPCPHCRQTIQLDQNPVIGQNARCENCGVMFEVVWLYPVTLDEVVEIRLPNYSDGKDNLDR